VLRAKDGASALRYTVYERGAMALHDAHDVVASVLLRPATSALVDMSRHVAGGRDTAKIDVERRLRTRGGARVYAALRYVRYAMPLKMHKMPRDMPC